MRVHYDFQNTMGIEEEVYALYILWTLRRFSGSSRKMGKRRNTFSTTSTNPRSGRGSSTLKSGWKRKSDPPDKETPLRVHTPPYPCSHAVTFIRDFHQKEKKKLPQNKPSRNEPCLPGCTQSTVGSANPRNIAAWTQFISSAMRTFWPWLCCTCFFFVVFSP